MHFQKKLGLGFMAFGLVIIVLAHAFTDSGAFVFSALMGVMAICFGGFQLMLSNLALQSKSGAKTPSNKTAKAKKARH